MSVLPAAQLRSQIYSKQEKSCLNKRSEKKLAKKLIDICLNKSFKESKPSQQSLEELAFSSRQVTQTKIPRSQVPCCSRCGSHTEIISGATFVSEDEEILKTSPLALWQCRYCRNYEITKSSLVLLLKRVFGRRKGSDVVFEVKRRPTFTRHGKISVNNGDNNFTCYVPVKIHIGNI